jgi:hypothetical protein
LINRGRIEVSFSALEYALKDSLHLDPKLVRIDSALRVITDLELVITGAFQPIIIDSITMDNELIAPRFYEVFSKKFDLDQNRIKLDPTVNNDTVTISLRPSLQRSYERIRSILKR